MAVASSNVLVSVQYFSGIGPIAREQGLCSGAVSDVKSNLQAGRCREAVVPCSKLRGLGRALEQESSLGSRSGSCVMLKLGLLYPLVPLLSAVTPWIQGPKT